MVISVVRSDSEGAAAPPSLIANVGPCQQGRNPDWRYPHGFRSTVSIEWSRVPAPATRNPVSIGVSWPDQSWTWDAPRSSFGGDYGVIYPRAAPVVAAVQRWAIQEAARRNIPLGSAPPGSTPPILVLEDPRHADAGTWQMAFDVKDSSMYEIRVALFNGGRAPLERSITAHCPAR